jgi:uncharacterized membrane protein YfcA
MDYILIACTAIVASGLTLFSGFGLGTILLPAFALFFPVDTAIAMTAIIHLLNNIFKFFLVGKHVDKEVVLKFGVTAFIFAILGAMLLVRFSQLPPIMSYSITGNTYIITPVKLVIGILILIFALLDFSTSFRKMALDRKWLPWGGVLSGFFGGLSGHQGAFRSAFLIKSGLSKEAFIATGVIIASIIDISRLFIYSSRFAMDFSGGNLSMLLTALIAAFIGAFIGARLIKKVTLQGIHLLVGILLIAIAIGIVLGII